MKFYFLVWYDKFSIGDLDRLASLVLIRIVIRADGNNNVRGSLIQKKIKGIESLFYRRLKNRLFEQFFIRSESNPG